MAARESKPGQYNCQVSGVGAVSDATTAARAFAIEQGVAGRDVSRLCVILEELVTNLYEHGGVTRSDCVSLTLSTLPGGIKIVLADPGEPFDPRTARSTKRRPARGGGAGINIVRAWTRFLDYSVQPGQNRLELLMPVHMDEIAPEMPPL
jgi:serine/threonine-protein kinase RsbW